MRAMVTGGANRLGRAIALALAEAGFDLELHFFSSGEEAAGVQAEIEALGRRCRLHRADLTLSEDCERLARDLAEGGEALDVLVHSAGLYPRRSLSEITAEEWDRVQHLHCRAAFLLVRDTAAMLGESTLPGGGLVLSISDIAASQPEPGFLHYCVSKAALEMLTKGLALELAPSVRVNAIAPGTVLAPPDLEEARMQAILSTIPQARFGEAGDIADLVVFLATKAPYVTGQVWSVDGGRSVAGPLVT